jgi:hypothetical protein
MAVADKINVGNIDIAVVTTDPSLASGVTALPGSLALMSDGSGSFIKTGAADVNWNRVIHTGNLVLITATGTITSGVWNGTTIAIANGGTGGTTAISAFNNLSPLNTKGDILVYDGSNNIKFPIGANGQTAIADSTKTSGLSWANIKRDVQGYDDATSITTTSTVFIDATNVVLTTNNLGEAGKYKITFNAVVSVSATPILVEFQLVVGGTALVNSRRALTTARANADYTINIELVVSGLNSGTVVKVQWRTASGTATLKEKSLGFIGNPNSQLA